MKLRALLILIFLISCSSQRAVPGPDKQGEGTISGAALGAGTGAVYGAQLSAGAGPGAAVGAAAGAVFGAISGAGKDILEEDVIRREQETKRLEEKLWAQGILAEHYQRRFELHPSRDIFPADLFFDGDSVELSQNAEILLRELAELSKNRQPWSRIEVSAYVLSKDPASIYANHLSKKRAKNIAAALIGAGIEPQRVLAKPVIITQPLVLDPEDSPARYSQAVEISMLD